MTPLWQLADKYAQEKIVPEYIWKSTWAEKRAFLSGIFEGDGCVSVLEECVLQISYSTKSEQLARDVQQMLLMFSIVSRVSKDEDRQQYCVYISNIADCERFAQNIGFASQKIARLTDMLDGMNTCRRGMVRDFVPHIANFVRNHPSLNWKARENLKNINIDRLNKSTDQYQQIALLIGDEHLRKIYLSLVEDKSRFYSKVSGVERTVSATRLLPMDSSTITPKPVCRQ
jgi:DNA gyrase subunit A